MTEIARSAWPFHASTSPAVFSTALPAIATITSPANAWEMCSWTIAGDRPLINESDTNAEATPRDEQQRERQPERQPRSTRRDGRRRRHGGLPGRRPAVLPPAATGLSSRRRLVGAQIRDDAREVHDEQAHRADG